MLFLEQAHGRPTSHGPCGRPGARGHRIGGPSLGLHYSMSIGTNIV